MARGFTAGSLRPTSRTAAIDDIKQVHALQNSLLSLINPFIVNKPPCSGQLYVVSCGVPCDKSADI